MYGTQVQWTAKPGKTTEAAAGALTFRSILERLTGVSTRAYTAVGGAPAGSFAVTARMASMRAITDIMQQLNTDEEYQELGRAVSPHVMGPAEIGIGRIINVTDGYESKPFVSAISAVIAPGQNAAAVAWCGEAIEFAHEVAGVSAAVIMSATGLFGHVQLVAGYDDADQYDEAFAKMSADPSYIALVDRGGPLFAAGTGHQLVAQQIG